MLVSNNAVALKLLLLLTAAVVGLSGTAIAESPAAPVAPKTSLTHLRVHPDCRVELAACEPQVIDPVAISFDEAGRMWVVEMRDYPHGPAEGEPPTSRIKVLRDTDNDGFFETAIVFADRLLFATGLQLWQDGAFVTVAGRIVLLRDTDGDLKADVEEVWYEGFAEQNSQLRANHPTLAMNGLIHVANGLRGGKIRNIRQGNIDNGNIDNGNTGNGNIDNGNIDNGAAEIELGGMDFAFDPHTGECRTVSGVGQFGLTFNAVGDRFVCSNRNPLIQIVIENRYLQRAGKTRLPSVSQDAATSGGDSRVYPISQAWTTSNLHAGQFTAACGVTIFGGNALGADFHGDAFTCEPTGSLVHRERFQETVGPALTTKPARDGVEFLASTDTWFRPVNLATGHDGRLYVADMYRAVIEHPQWMPEELKTRPDLLLGNDKGRIYRVVSSASAANEPSKFDESSLVDRLDSQNQRDVETAFRLILQDREKSADAAELIDELKAMLTNAKNEWAGVRALWLLKHLNELEQTHLDLALASSNRQLVRQALIISESLEEESNADADVRPELPEAVSDLVASGDPIISFQAALSSLFFEKPNSWRKQLARPCLAADGDQWVEAALVMASGGESDAILESMVSQYRRQLIQTDQQPAELLGRLLTAASVESICRALIDVLADEFPHDLNLKPEAVQNLRLSFLSDAVAVFRRRNLDLTNFQPGFQEYSGESSRNELDRLLLLLEKSLADADGDSAQRIAAMQILSYFERQAGTIRKLALAEMDPDVRRAAIEVLHGEQDHNCWKALLAGFPEESPQIRQQVVAAATRDADVAKLLLVAIRSGSISPREIDRAARQRLIKSSDPEVSAPARELLASVIDGNRAAVLKTYMTAAQNKGDPLRGKQLFTRHCATCHRFGDVGMDVGPDISDTRTRTKEQLLNDIINPNGAIDANYVSYMVQTFDGKSYAGVIASENAANVTLRMPEGKTVLLLRSEIEELASTGQSLMPEGFEQDIPVEDMTDLLDFLKNWRYLDGAVPLE